MMVQTCHPRTGEAEAGQAKKPDYTVRSCFTKKQHSSRLTDLQKVRNKNQLRPDYDLSVNTEIKGGGEPHSQPSNTLSIF